jgi:ubiquitin-conjugating enzyme E2 M
MDAVLGTRLEFPDANNLMNFSLYVTPTDGLYKGAEFKFTLAVPASYPYDPPKAQCNTLVISYYV